MKQAVRKQMITNRVINFVLHDWVIIRASHITSA